MCYILFYIFTQSGQKLILMKIFFCCYLNVGDVDGDSGVVNMWIE